MKEIVNKSSILNDINKSLGVNSNPAVEYLITMPYGLIKLPFGLGSINYNWFGHSALRYTTPDGKDIVVNIEAKEKGKNFIQFYDADEYLFGTTSAQKGIYQRDIVGLRIENVNPIDIEKMHQYILKLEANNNNNDSNGDKVRFNIVLGPILNFIGKFFPNLKYNFPEYGNCARWTSSMLFEAGLTTKYFVWPKTVFINMFENYSKTNVQKLSNMNVVYYERAENVSKPFYGVKDRPVWFDKSVAPFQTIRNYFYGDLKHFAKTIVKVEPEKNVGMIEIKPDNQISYPNNFRNILNSKYFIFTFIITSIFIYKKGFSVMKNFYKKYSQSVHKIHQTKK